MTSVTVLSYNIRSMRDDNEALVRVIRQVAPDVAIVQEAPRMLRWRSTCAALARRTGMVLVAGGRQAGANLVLSTLAVKVLATHEVSFTDRPNLHHRGAALAVAELGGRKFAIAGTHLDLIEEPRLAHLDEFSAVVRAKLDPEIPLIIGGDINAVPGSASWLRLERFGVDAFAAVGEGPGYTYSATAPVRRIDGLFADPRLRPVHAEVLDSADVRLASDHRPLVVQFEFS